MREPKITWVGLAWIVYVVFAVSFLGGVFAERGRNKAVVDTYEEQISLVVEQRNQCQSELATMQSIIKRLVDGETK